MVVSHVKLFAQQQQDQAAIGVRVVAAHKRAVLEALSRAGTYRDHEELATAVALAVLSAEDHSETRYCVVTQDPRGQVDVYGPFLSRQAAQSAMNAGWCARTADTRGFITPLTVTPKSAPRTLPPIHKKSAKKRRPQA